MGDHGHRIVLLHAGLAPIREVMLSNLKLPMVVLNVGWRTASKSSRIVNPLLVLLIVKGRGEHGQRIVLLHAEMARIRELMLSNLKLSMVVLSGFLRTESKSSRIVSPLLVLSIVKGRGEHGQRIVLLHAEMGRNRELIPWSLMPPVVVLNVHTRMAWQGSSNVNPLLALSNVTDHGRHGHSVLDFVLSLTTDCVRLCWRPQQTIVCHLSLQKNQIVQRMIAVA